MSSIFEKSKGFATNVFAKTGAVLNGTSETSNADGSPNASAGKSYVMLVAVVAAVAAAVYFVVKKIKARRGGRRRR